jgi:hypothetical protein
MPRPKEVLTLHVFLLKLYMHFSSPPRMAYGHSFQLANLQPILHCPIYDPWTIFMDNTLLEFPMPIMVASF